MITTHETTIHRGTTNNVAPTDAGTPLADDFMPATIATLPILTVVLLFALSGQPVLLRAILYEGNPLALAASLLPLFLPTLAALAVYLSAARGWIRQGPVATTATAMALAGGLALFVPLNYLFLQAGALAVALVWRRIGRLRKLTRFLILAATVLAVIMVTGLVAEWKWLRADHLPRTAVGRALDGVTQMNIGEEGQRRSVMVISVNDAYAIVASRGYPPRVDNVPLDVLDAGQICQTPPNWNQRSVVDHVHEWLVNRPASPTPSCVVD